MTRTAVKFPRWLTWHAGERVEVEKVTSRAFFATTYAVFRNGEMVGYVASRPERGHSTLWAYAVGEERLGVAGSPSRGMAVSDLLCAVIEQNNRKG